MPFARNLTAAAQTDTELVAAPGAGRQIVVTLVYITSDSAEEVTFESSTGNLRWKAFLSAQSTTSAVDASRELFRCNPNEALTYTTTATGDTFVSVDYHIARSTGA